MISAWSVDRLGRSLQHLVGFLNKLQALNCNLYLHQQAINTTTPSGRAMFQMCGVFAEFERSMIVERVNAGLARAKANGVKLGRGNRKDHKRSADEKGVGRGRTGNAHPAPPEARYGHSEGRPDARCRHQRCPARVRADTPIKCGLNRQPTLRTDPFRGYENSGHLSRLFTALNLLPSMATLAVARRPISRQSSTKRAHTLRNARPATEMRGHPTWAHHRRPCRHGITSLNLVGCMTGKSAGLAPRNVPRDRCRL